jgi:hypothetical protein
MALRQRDPRSIMRRKYQVFISSSFEDLKEHREGLIIATLRERHIPFGMEMLHGSTVRSLDLIEERIRESDIFVVLVGARHGSRISDEPKALAFTETEYELALKYKLPVLAFVLNDAEYKEARDKLRRDDPEREADDDLDRFRSRVAKTDGGSRNVVRFSMGNVAHLREQYSGALHDAVGSIEENGSRGGWVRGSAYDALNSQIHLDTAVDNEFFRDMAKSLNRFSKLAERTKVRKASKQAISRFFWERYFAKLHEKNVPALYFESGSSIAFVSQEFIQRVLSQSDSWAEQGMNERVRVSTNNVLTYLQFTLRESPWRPMDVRLNPPGPISDDYGGTYGELRSVFQESAPTTNDIRRLSLPEGTMKRVNRVRTSLLKALSQSGLVLMTASGVDTNPDSPYPGPHVGSYHNMLLKRALLSLDCPKVLFLHPEKWGFGFRWGNCHAVCDPAFSWERAKELPLAIALSADSSEAQRDLADELAANGFVDLDLEEPQSGSRGSWGVVAANRPFTEFFRVR